MEPLRFAEQTCLTSNMNISLTLSVKANSAAWNVATTLGETDPSPPRCARMFWIVWKIQYLCKELRKTCAITAVAAFSASVKIT